MILVCEAPRYSISLIQATAMKAAAHKGPPSTRSCPLRLVLRTVGMRQKAVFARMRRLRELRSRQRVNPKKRLGHRAEGRLKRRTAHERNAEPRAAEVANNASERRNRRHLRGSLACR